MHRRYEEFSEQLIKDMETFFRSLQLQTEHARKRNTLRMLTELFFKGVFKEYRRIFKCLIQIIQVCPEKDSKEVFENGLLVVHDYMKVYGERVFGVLARDHKEDINNDFEVALKDEDRHNFLQPKTRQEIYKYLVKSYYEQKCLVHLANEYQKLKAAQQAYEDNLKEIAVDENLAILYKQEKESFQKLYELTKSLANVLDVDVPEYKVEEVKIVNSIVLKRN